MEHKEIKARSLLGKYIAKALAEQYNKVAILLVKDNFCYSLASSIYSNLFGIKKVDLFLIDDLELVASKIAKDYDGVLLLIGKNTKDDKVKEITLEVINQLKAENYEGDFIFHMRISKAMNNFFDLNNSLKNYLLERVYSYKINFQEGTIEIYYVDLEKNSIEVVREIDTDFEFVKNAVEVYAKKQLKIE